MKALIRVGLVFRSVRCGFVNSDPAIVPGPDLARAPSARKSRDLPDVDAQGDIMCIAWFCKDTNIRSMICIDLNANGVCVRVGYIHGGALVFGRNALQRAASTCTGFNKDNG